MQNATKTDGADETLHFLDYWRVISSRKEVAIIAFLLVTIAGVAATFAMRKTYVASVLVQVQKETPDVPVFHRDMLRFDPQFLRTQFEIIQSRPVLEETIRRLNLTEKFATALGLAGQSPERMLDRTLRLLSSGMKAQQYRDTNLIEIQVYIPELGTEPETAPIVAAQVANAIADVYRGQNLRRSRDQKVAGLDALRDALEERRLAVLEAEKRVEDIRERHQITLLSRAAGTDTSLDKITLQVLEQRRILVGQELVDKRSRFERLSGLSERDRLHAAQHVVRDPGLEALVAQRRKAEVELQQRLQAFGDRHPEVMQTRAVIDELSRKIEEALQGLMTGLRIETEALQAQYDEMSAQLEERKAQERAAEAEGYREFEKATEALEHAKKMRDMLEFRYMEEHIELNIPRTTVEVMAEAKPPDIADFVRPNIWLNIILSLALGLAAGLGLAFFVEYLDTSVKTIDDVEKHMGVPVLGVIPQKIKPFTNEKARLHHAEAYRVLRANIQFSKRFQNGKALCVTSGSVGEGKSLTIFNLAYVCAQLGDKVLLVDADLHRPTQHKMFGIDNRTGLANVLAGDMAHADAVQKTTVQNLHFMPSGKMGSGTHGLMDTALLGSLVDIFKSRYDYVFFDAPPIMGVSDASRIAREMDGVLQVVQHRKYPWTLSNRARFSIENVGGKVIGVVLNNLNISRDYSYYGYGYYNYERYPQKKAKA